MLERAGWWNPPNHNRWFFLFQEISESSPLPNSKSIVVLENEEASTGVGRLFLPFQESDGVSVFFSCAVCPHGVIDDSPLGR
jgi:hypothetical protein